MTEQETAARTFCATIKHDEDEFTQDFMWADNLGVNAEACSIEDESCEACGS